MRKKQNKLFVNAYFNFGILQGREYRVIGVTIICCLADTLDLFLNIATYIKWNLFVFTTNKPFKLRKILQNDID